MTSERLYEQITGLAREIAHVVERHPGRLVAVTVAAKGRAEEIDQLLTWALTEAGLDFVDVTVRSEEGPFRLVSAEFEPAPRAVGAMAQGGGR